MCCMINSLFHPSHHQKAIVMFGPLLVPNPEKPMLTTLFTEHFIQSLLQNGLWQVTESGLYLEAEGVRWHVCWRTTSNATTRFCIPNNVFYASARTLWNTQCTAPNRRPRIPQTSWYLTEGNMHYSHIVELAWCGQPCTNFLEYRVHCGLISQ